MLAEAIQSIVVTRVGPLARDFHRAVKEDGRVIRAYAFAAKLVIDLNLNDWLLPEEPPSLADEFNPPRVAVNVDLALDPDLAESAERDWVNWFTQRGYRVVGRRLVGTGTKEKSVVELHLTFFTTYEDESSKESDDAVEAAS